MTNDGKLFNSGNVGYPLYEGKMMHQFDPYFVEPVFGSMSRSDIKRLVNARYENWHTNTFSTVSAFREMAAGN